MSSNIQYIALQGCTLPDEFSNMDALYESLDNYKRSVFLLGQACIVNYIDKMFGVRSTPYLPSYKQGLLIKIRQHLLNAQQQNQLDNVASMEAALILLNVPTAIDHADMLNKVDIDHIIETLFASECEGVPLPVVPEFLLPYLHFINALTEISLNKQSVSLEQQCYTYTGNAKLPVIGYWGRYMSVDYTFGNDQLLQFDMTTSVLDDVYVVKYPICKWILCFKWTGYTVNQLIAALTSVCSQRGVNHSDTCGAQLLYALYCRVYQDKPLFCKDIYLDSQERDLLKHIILVLHKRDGLLVTDRSLLGRLFETGYQDKSKPTSDDYLVEFFSADNVNDVSQEAWLAFKTSDFGKINELNVKFSNVDAEEGAEESTDDDQQPEQDEANPEPPAEEATQETEPETETTTEDDTPEDDGEVPEADLETADDDTQDDTDTDGTEENDTHTPLPPPSTDDKKGIRIAFATLEDETPDSAMFRYEMEGFLDAILANPPKNLTKQKIDLLYKVKNELLYVLHISALRDIVASATKLPVAFKRFKSLPME